MTLWIVFGVMLVIASVIVVWPIYHHHRRLSAISAGVVVAVAGLSVFVYSEIGTPNVNDAPAAPGNIEDMVASLDARLQDNPDDLDGWKMLGRSYINLDNLPKAIAAFEQAVALESSSNADTLISLGEAVFMSDRDSINGRAGALFESAFALAPDNPRALFFAGLSAAQTGNTVLAAARWETLLAVGPPPEIEDVVRQRVAEWRGEPPPMPKARPGDVDDAAVVSVDIDISDSAVAAIDPAATVFIIARDPGQPRPPLAVVRRKAHELPATVTLSDSNAMVPGRVPSAYDQLEVIVRISGGGQPIAQPGDWFGQGLIRPGKARTIAITIDQQVP